MNKNGHFLIQTMINIKKYNSPGNKSNADHYSSSRQNKSMSNFSKKDSTSFDLEYI
jgi:hypothetical protein